MFGCSGVGLTRATSPLRWFVDVSSWPSTDMPSAPNDVRLQEQSGNARKSDPMSHLT